MLPLSNIYKAIRLSILWMIKMNVPLSKAALCSLLCVRCSFDKLYRENLTYTTDSPTIAAHNTMMVQRSPHQTLHEFPTSVLPSNPVVNMFPPIPMNSTWYTMMVDDYQCGDVVCKDVRCLTMFLNARPSAHISDGALPYVWRRWWLTLVDGGAPLRTFDDVHRGVIHALSCNGGLSYETNPTTQRMRCLYLPAIDSAQIRTTPTLEDLRETFLRVRLRMVNTFLERCVRLVNDTTNASVRDRLSIIMGWILHDGIRSVWKQLYELQHRQMYLTWSTAYDAKEIDEAENRNNIRHPDIAKSEEGIHVVVRFWYGVLQSILQKITLPAILIGAGSNANPHTHCNILEPLMSGCLGLDGSIKQKHETKKGEMYMEQHVVGREPNKLNVIVHAKVVRLIDSEMGVLKDVVREWLKRMEGCGGNDDRLKTWRAKLV